MSIKIKIEFDTSNAAFDLDPMAEARSVIEQSVWILERLGVGEAENLYDSNGNRVGQVSTYLSD
jgi:hypothetical protein